MIQITEKNKQLFFLVTLTLITLGAGYYIARCTEYAPWGFSDSATYLSSARNLAAGVGLGVLNPDGSFAPLLIFAPFYSIFLTPFAAFGAALVAVAGVLDVVFFALLVASSGWLFFLLTRSYWASSAFALLIATTPVLLTVYTSIMSDPLAIVLGIPGFLLLLYAIKQSSTKWMVLSALLSGLSLFTRYAFFAFAAAGIFCLLVLPSKPMRQRLLETLKYAVISLAPMTVWIIIQLLSRFSIGSRHYTLGFSFAEKLAQFFAQVYEVLKYWLPYRSDMIPGVSADAFRPLLLVFYMLVLFIGFFFSAKHRKEPSLNTSWIILCGLIVLTLFYGAMLLVTFSVSTELISLDDRMLSPMIPVIYGLLLTGALVVDQKIHPKVSFPILAAIIALFFFAYHYTPVRTLPAQIGKFPNGYTSSVWKENPLLSGAVLIPSGRPLVSNAPDILLFYTNRNAYYLSASPASTGTRISILDQTELSELMTENCAVLVLFDPNKAEQFEHLSDPITNQQADDLQSQYQSLYTSENGMLLMDENCTQ